MNSRISTNLSVLVFLGLILASAPALAVQERLPLDGIGANGCDWMGCTVANLDDDPDAAGADWATAADNNTNHSGHFTFPTPSQPLTAGAGLQEFRVSLRKNATCGSGTPTARIELWEAGGQVRAGVDFSVTAPNGGQQVASFTWDATEITNAADVEIQVVGTKSGGAPASRCAVDLGAVEWNAETSAAANVTTLGDGTDPAASSLCPGDAETVADVFTLVTDGNTDAVTDVTVMLSPMGSFNNLAQVRITDAGGVQEFGVANNPAADSLVIPLTGLDATASVATYEVRITPKTHAAMAAPPGASFAVTAPVTAFTPATNSTAGSDNDTEATTVDNGSPLAPVPGAVTPGDNQLQINWTDPGDADFQEVIIVRRQGGAVTGTPTEGQTYAVNDTLVAGETVVFVGTDASSPWIDTGVTNGNSYWYAIFARDACVNWSAAGTTGPHTPASALVRPGTAAATDVQCDSVTLEAPFLDDANANSTTDFERRTGANCLAGGYAAVAGCTGLGGASPRTCVDTTVAASTDYCYRVTFNDADGVNTADAANPQTIGPITTPACGGNTTTLGDGTDPAASSLCPGDAETVADVFTLVTDGNVDAVTDVTVTLSPAGSFNNLSQVRITDVGGVQEFGVVNNPASDTLVISLTGLDATAALATYEVRITPKTHAAMAAPPGASFAITAPVTAFTPAANSTAGSDNDTEATTVDNASPAGSTFASCTGASPSQIDLTWTNPGSDFAGVVVVRGPAGGACPTFAPVEGTSYSPGPQGADQIVFVGAAAAASDTGLLASTSYCYEVWSFDPCNNYFAGPPDATTCSTQAAGNTTTLGDGTDPVAAPSLCPGDGATVLDAFSFQTDGNSDVVDDVTVTLVEGGGGNAFEGLASVEIVNVAGSTVFGQVTNPVSDVVNIPLSLNTLTATSVLTQYRVRVTPKTHAAMPAPPSQAFVVTGTVTAFTPAGNAAAGNDVDSDTVTVDNGSPGNAVWGAITPGDGQVTLSWTDPGDADFQQVIIVRRLGGSITGTPVEGQTYLVNDTLAPGDVVVFAGTDVSSPWTDTGVANGNPYWYKIFARDIPCANWSTGAETGPHTPNAPAQNNTTVTAHSAEPSSCEQITTSTFFTGDQDDDGSTLVEYRTPPGGGVWTTACAQVTGASPRQCLVIGLAAGTQYELQFTTSDPDGISDAVPNPIATTPACANGAPPTILVLAPKRDAVVGGADRVKVQVWDADDANPTVEWSVDGGVFANATENTNYTCGTNCRVFEFVLDTLGLGLTNGSHYFTVQATDAGANKAVLNRGFQVNNVGGRAGGAGLLLRRTPGSQVCVDCHNLPTHSSQTTDTGYGNWAMECLDCHTPHGTTNVFLIRGEIRTPSSGKRPVRFEDNSVGAAGNTSVPGSASFVNEDNATRADGPCQACHTRTGGAIARWRNAAGGGNAQSHFTTGAGTRPCTDCHVHAEGFRGAGGDCLGCHGDQSQGSSPARRTVNPDFMNGTSPNFRSHHVGNGGTMGGQLTAFDCVVCHAEGRIDTSGAEPAPTTVGTYHGGDGGTKTVDLKDADNWDDATGTGTVYSYDKRAVCLAVGGTAAECDTQGAAVLPDKWGSGNAVWRTETSQNLDPFCLSCHDSTGATASRNQNLNEGCSAGGNSLNPFCDGAITNNYDQQDRGGVVDIASRVVAGPSDPDRDMVGEPRGPDGIPDPPQGIYSRHAIRGKSQSVYTVFQNIAIGNTMWEGDATAGQSLLVQRAEVDEFGDPLWNDTSVMGCGDCHTVDGANGANGNAHGSPSEYLLKDAMGTATEGTRDALTYVCYRCHEAERYQPPGGALGDHTGNSNEWGESVADLGILRRDDGDKGKGANFFGIACMNCHGGVDWGTIHGTSQVLGIGRDGTGLCPDNRSPCSAPTRPAYRFTNGADLRYYEPNGWTGTAITCYTLSAGDAWGGCTQHDRGQDFTKPLQRDIKY